MRKYLRVLCVTGLLAGLVLVGACGGGGGDAAAPPPNDEPTTVEVSAANVAPGYDASTDDVVFNVHPIPVGGDPVAVYIVDNFDAGDKLVYDAGTDLEVVNISPVDGIIDVTGTLDGKAITVHLTDIQTGAGSPDQTIFSPDTFNTAFGAGSLLP